MRRKEGRGGCRLWGGILGILHLEGIANDWEYRFISQIGRQNSISPCTHPVHLFKHQNHYFPPPPNRTLNQNLRNHLSSYSSESNYRILHSPPSTSSYNKITKLRPVHLLLYCQCSSSSTSEYPTTTLIRNQ